MTFNIILKHAFPKNSIEFPLVVHKIWRNSLSILAIFINFPQFLNFLTLPCYKETNDVRLQQMMSAFFHFQHTLHKMFNNFIKLYCY